MVKWLSKHIIDLNILSSSRFLCLDDDRICASFFLIMRVILFFLWGCVCVCVMFMHGDGHVSFFVLYIYLVPATCILFLLCFYNLFSAWLVVSYRGLAEEKRPLSPSSGPYQAEDKIAQQTVICHSNPASLSSTESSEGGKTLFFVCPMEIINCAIWKVENLGHDMRNWPIICPFSGKDQHWLMM